MRGRGRRPPHAQPGERGARPAPGGRGEEDEAAALEAAAEAGDAAVVAELDDEDAPITLEDVESVHVDLDGTGDLAWYARQELPAVLEQLTRP